MARPEPPPDTLERAGTDIRQAEGPAGDALEASGLERSYGKTRIVKGVSLRVANGEVVGLLGPNGAGKTTTFYMIVGLLQPHAGQILLHGKDITNMPMYRRARMGIGYLSQEPSIFRRLTVWENVMAVLETLPMTKEDRHRRCEELLSDLDIMHLKDRRGMNLSGGERRRTEISRALVTNPSFILLDEPFVGIDPIAVAEIQQIIRSLRSRGLGVLITDHSVRETLGATDRAYLMYEGRILLTGTAEELASDPQARKLYLGDNFRL